MHRMVVMVQEGQTLPERLSELKKATLEKFEEMFDGLSDGEGIEKIAKTDVTTDYVMDFGFTRGRARTDRWLAMEMMLQQLAGIKPWDSAEENVKLIRQVAKSAQDTLDGGYDNPPKITMIWPEDLNK